MAITDLLDRIPFSPRTRPPERPAAAESASERSFPLDVLHAERVGIDLPEGVVPPIDPEPSLGAAPSLDAAPALDPVRPLDPGPPTLPAPPSEAAAPPPPEPIRARVLDVSAARSPLPSYAVALIGGLSLLSLALAVALALAVGGESVTAAAPPVAAGASAPAGALAADTSGPTPVSTSAEPTRVAADPEPIPVDLLTRLDAASAEPLEVELSRLLDAMQHGFGRRGAELEPTLQSYVYRMVSRFEWNPNTFRIAVTAPDADLARERGALLERLFEDAVASGRLQIGAGAGPHALTLVTE